MVRGAVLAFQAMKNLLLIAVTILAVGCGEKHVSEVKAELDGVNYKELEISENLFNEIAYHKGSPYTGKSFELYDNGQKSSEGNYKEGFPDGLWVFWHKNGQKKSEENYKDGEKVSEEYWNSKGEPVDSWKEARK